MRHTRSTSHRSFTARSGFSLGIVLLLTSSPAFSCGEECGSPSPGANPPTSADALHILREAVDLPGACEQAGLCVCDVNASGSVTALDALTVLREAVGQDVTLACDCGTPASVPCSSFEVTVRAGSELDFGWTGLGHESPIAAGASGTLRVMHRCSGSAAQCGSGDDCPQGESCVATCDCLGDTTCEVTGAFNQRVCRNTLMDCTTNADCIAPDVCVYGFGPPQPLVVDGTPICITSTLETEMTGTVNVLTGEAALSAVARSRTQPGTVPFPGEEEAGGPCPVCGRPGQDPAVGDAFTCDGGQNAGEACTVEAVSSVYGGVSSDCPAVLALSTTGSGSIIRFEPITTETVDKVAELPCRAIGFMSNPTLPNLECVGGTNNGGACTTNANCPGGGFCNTPKCIDTNTACTTNADCRRCTGDPSTDCTTDDECSGQGVCAEAPEQPISCGFWCSSGFCNNNPNLPCLESADCPAGQTCQVGTGGATSQNSPQPRPNNCSLDGFICGLEEPERCANTSLGTCSLKPWLPSCVSNADCSQLEGGDCMIGDRPCFGASITREGAASAPGCYCAGSASACSSNLDCPEEDDNCVPDAMVPRAVAVFSAPATSSGTVNNALGITGPAAIRLDLLVNICRCGDAVIGCDEECEDSNTVAGDGCDGFCQTE